jgi:molybdopterin synthase catalytic subunit
LDARAIESLVRDDARGGLVTFAGAVRRLADDGRPVTGLAYEAHEAMAIAEFAKIAGEAEARFANCAIAIHHRTGDLAIGDVAVVVAVASAHRVEAFEACRYAIDELKHRAPIWKRERYADGSSEWKQFGAQEHA